MFGVLDLRKAVDGRLFVEDRYCHQIYYFDKGAFDKRTSFIPDNRIFNTEHTWPQSKFSSRFSKGLQKSDLHALYPVQTQANNLRSNLSLFFVERPESQSCAYSQKGQNALFNEKVFEPPDTHKGNAARSIFYFIVRYNLSLPKEYETTLRLWHKLDPVDNAERTRNQGIFEFQSNRNPFVDYEAWLEYLEL
jgi:endonuclease I